MKSVYVVLFLLFSWLTSPHLATAQQSKRDSLENLLQKTGPDTNRVIILNKASGLNFSSNPKKAKEFAEQALKLSQKLVYRRGIGRSYLSLANYYWSRGDFQQGIAFAKIALPYFEQLNDQAGIASAYSTIGLSLKGLGDFSQAIAFYFKSLRMNEKSGDTRAIAKVYNNIGVLFKQQEKYDQALFYYRQAFHKYEGIDSLNQAGALLNIGQVYLLTKDFPKAISYLNQARTRFAALNEALGLVMCDNNLGEAYIQMKQFKRAEPFTERALQTASKLGYTPSTVTGLLNLGAIRLESGRASESFAFFNKALLLVETLHQQNGRLTVYKGLASAYAQTGNFAMAYLFQTKWMALKDSTFNEENTQKITRIQADYQFEKKQAEIELLKKEQQVSRLWRNTVGGGLLALLIITGLITSRQRLKIRNDQVLLTQSKVVANKNQQLESQTKLLEAQAQQLQELDDLKSRFFTNITHEFRTPLTLIIGILSEKLHVLTDQTDTLIRKTEVTVMYRNAQRLLHLINQLLDLSRIESGSLDLQLESRDIKPLLSMVSGLFSSLAEQRNISLSMHLSSDNLSVSHDADQLEKVITNLLSNAFKFTPDGGEINVQAEQIQVAGNPFVQVIIDDTGIGVAPDQAERVFERFYQGATTRSDRQPGTGVGLSLVKEIIQLHNGTIQILSKSGPGARVVVLLPFVEEINALSHPTAGRPVQKNEQFLVADLNTVTNQLPEKPIKDNRIQVLIVEDNEDVRMFISSLMQAQYRVLESTNGLQGLKLAQDHLPDMIISDWMMPDMDGLELCHRIKTDDRTSHIPFMLLTALSAQDNRLSGLQTGADDYLTKPFDSRELLIRTQNLVTSRQKLHERFSREIRVQPKDISVTSADERFLLKVMQIVEDNLGNSSFSVEQFGQEIALSRMQLHRKLIALTGQPAGDFIRIMRLKRAAQLLEGRKGNVSEIAYEVGFNSLPYFAKCFREQFGMAPHEYQGQLANQVS